VNFASTASGSTPFTPSTTELVPHLRELAESRGKPYARKTLRKILIAEDEQNDPAIVTTLGMDAVWADDFHHQVHVTLTGERDGYYRAYDPGPSDMAA